MAISLNGKGDWKGPGEILNIQANHYQHFHQKSEPLLTKNRLLRSGTVERENNFVWISRKHSYFPLSALQLQIKIISNLEYSQWPRCASSVDELQKEIKIYDTNGPWMLLTSYTLGAILAPFYINKAFKQP